MLMKPLMHQSDIIKYIEKPNLPQGKVAQVAISIKAGETVQKLNSLNINTIKISENNFLPKPENSHADLQILHLGKNTILCHEDFENTQLSKDFTVKKISSTIGNKYPNNVKMNCAIIGNKIICNVKTIAKEVLEYAYKLNLTVINVNQGYTNCSVCTVSENAVITDDLSVGNACEKHFDDVLIVSKGSVLLPGYNYGFIGGCCGKIDKNKLAFNGQIESHDDCNKIIDFLERKNVECVELFNGRLTDIGGIIPLCEYV